MRTILLISPYWREEHRWMVSSVKLAELWQRLGYRVVVLCMGTEKQQLAIGNWQLARPVSIEKISETLTVHRVPDFFIPDPWNYGIAPGFSLRALLLARSIKPDIIVTNKVLFWSSMSMLFLRVFGYPVILTTDALVGITWWPRGRIAKVCAAMYAWTLGWLILLAATKVVFFHPQPERVLERLGIGKKSMVIPTGIDPSGYSAGTRNTGLVVTYVGRLESVKGVDDFVAAALKVKNERSDITVRVVGWYAPGHPLVTVHHDRVDFTGLRSDIPQILSETDIFVLPSYAEGLSNALMEAMSSSCACIASDVGGNAYLIQNGVSGLLFPPGDREALASHIRRLVDDTAKRLSLGQAARKRIDDVFSWNSVGKKYTELFSSWHA